LAEAILAVSGGLRPPRVQCVGFSVDSRNTGVPPGRPRLDGGRPASSCHPAFGGGVEIASWQEAN